jgi:hypothetical protein
MLGYLLGAYLTSISVGLLIVFELHGTQAVSSARHTLTPAEDLVFGMIAIAVGLALRSGRVERRRKRGNDSERESGPQRLLGRGSPRVAFAVGAALSLPGASYLVALNRMAHLDAGNAAIVLLVIAFCVIQMLLLELPLVGYALSPTAPKSGLPRSGTGSRGGGRQTAATGAVAIGLLLLLRGLLELVL